MAIPVFMLNDELCTFQKRESHWRGDKYIEANYCGDVSVVRLRNPVDGSRYYMCRAHWDDRATWTADRMGLIVERLNGDSVST